MVVPHNVDIGVDGSSDASDVRRSFEILTVRSPVLVPGGLNHADKMRAWRPPAPAARVASALGCRAEEVLVCSTGVIGLALPMEKVRAGIDGALAALSGEREAGRRFLHAIMTTDA